MPAPLRRQLQLLTATARRLETLTPFAKHLRPPFAIFACTTKGKPLPYICTASNHASQPPLLRFYLLDNNAESTLRCPPFFIANDVCVASIRIPPTTLHSSHLHSSHLVHQSLLNNHCGGRFKPCFFLALNPYIHCTCTVLPCTLHKSPSHTLKEIITSSFLKLVQTPLSQCVSMLVKLVTARKHVRAMQSCPKRPIK